MSGSEERDASRLVRELADTAGAVPVLVTLLECGGSASRKALLAAGDGRDVDGAIRWLTAVDLVHRPGTSWTIDLNQHGTSYELTAIGATLTRSLMELADALSDPTATPRREGRIAEE
jgi:hypothetical protein